MDLPDCPPGAEGYQDSVTEVPKKPEVEESSTCTKAEQEFQEHLNSLKIRLEDGSTRCMVERRGRDISGKWIYLCYPCAAVCSGESILQTHISGKKHKIKLTMRTVWPKSIFDDHPFNQNANKTATASEKVLQKMAEEVDLHNKNCSELEMKYDKYRNVNCHIQDSLDAVKAPLLGVEYLVEHPPEQVHHEPTYMCTLCSKQGHPRTIINHMTCFWHRYNYLLRHYPQACGLLTPYRAQQKYREGVGVIMNRLAQRIEDKYGRKRPVNIEKEEYERDREQIHQWIFRGHHFSEKDGATFTEVVDIGLIDSLYKSNELPKSKSGVKGDKREPSPPKVAAPSKPLFNNFSTLEVAPAGAAGGAGGPAGAAAGPSRPAGAAGGPAGAAGGPAGAAGGPAGAAGALVRKKRCRTRPRSRRCKRAPPPPVIILAPPLPELTNTETTTDTPSPTVTDSVADRPAGRQERRAGSAESLSDISDDADNEHRRDPTKLDRHPRDRHDSSHKARYEPYPDKRRGPSPFRSRFAIRNQPVTTRKSQEKQRAPNYEYKVKLAEEKRQAAEDSAKKTLAYHEKNPEKHPLYPEEWKKFWNKRYKEIQGEGKDPSKHDFKPEWIVFWTARMKELHEEELRVQVNEIYRRLCLSPPAVSKRPSDLDSHRKSPDLRRKSPDLRRKSPDLRRKSPESRHKSSEPRRRSPDSRRRSPDRRRPDRPDRYEFRGREPLPRRRTPPDMRRDRRSPPPHPRRSPIRRRSPERRRSPPPKRTRSRSPLHRRSPARTHISLESLRRSSRSPLSQREQQRNRSPEHARAHVAPSMQTVLISDDELKPDDGLSPWNSDNDIDSVGSGPTSRSRTGSLASRASKPRRAPPCAGQPVESAADDVVATLRLLVALEDYLGSLGPRIVDLLAEALKMEKEKPNSSEELLERESAVVLMETAKEKLKGAVQAGLVGGSAAAALRAAVVRAAATLHEADKRASRRQAEQNAAPKKPAVVPVAGVGQVDRAQIAQQMAEALIAQGKTDVSSEELAQLVDAVVGMAEAKKREAEKAKKVVVRPSPVVTAKPALPKLSGTASALQMLQSAYDENDKNRLERDDAPVAMDGLSDSDLETLLKNFNELSAEEQHSLIAYLKKLEAKEPERVERLRQYVSEAASTAPKDAAETEDSQLEELKTVVVESDDDDDYTVEEVFQSATMKVKEDQIRQEMEIVKKSLEETKPEPSVEPTTLENSLADITKSLSSATDLFALVQASMKAAPAAAAAPLSRSPSLVASNTQPRSFGDLPEPPMVTQEPLKPLLSIAPLTSPPITSFNTEPQSQAPAPFQNQQGGLLRPPIRHQPPQQEQQLRPQHNQQQNYQPPQQNQQQSYQPQSQQQNYQPPQSQQQNYQPPQSQQQNYQSPPQNQQQTYQPPPQNQQQQQNYQPPQQNYNQQQQHNYQPPQHQQQNNQQYNQPQQNQQQYQPPLHQQYQPPQHQQQNFNDNRNKPNENFNQGSWNQRPNNMMDNRGPPMRGSAPDNFGSNAPYNQGPRNNFMNGRGQDNRPQNMNQQYGNYDNNQNNFRGRGGGRGHYGGPMRGRGRGYY